MREAEFLPAWYVERRCRSARRALRTRLWATAVCCGLCMSGAVYALSATQTAVGQATPDAGATASVDPVHSGPDGDAALTVMMPRAICAIRRALPAGVRVTQVTFRTGPRGTHRPTIDIKLCGESNDAAELGVFIESLRASHCFSDVATTATQPTAPGANSFAISLRGEP